MPDTLALYFFNVGHGDCTYLILPNTKRVLIDAGCKSRGARAYFDAVWDAIPDTKLFGQIIRLDALVLTHPDDDHYNYVHYLVKDTVVKKLYCSSERQYYKGYAFRKWYWGIGRNGSNIESMEVLNVNPATPTRQLICDGTREGGTPCRLWALASNVPVTTPGEMSSWGYKVNTGSIVVKCEFGDQSFIVAGDATVDTEAFLLSQYPPGTSNELDVNLLRIGHHGSETSSSQAFLDAVSPREAVISEANPSPSRYCTPRKDVMDRIKAAVADGADEHLIDYYTALGLENRRQEQTTRNLWVTGCTGTRSYQLTVP